MCQKPDAVDRPSDESEEHGTLPPSLPPSHAGGISWDGPRSEKEEDLTGGKMVEVQSLLGEGDLFDLISVLRRLGHFASKHGCGPCCMHNPFEPDAACAIH